MKRFITYLYECEKGNKTKNVGFVRVNVRGAETTMEVQIRNYLYSNDAGIIFALIYEKELFGIGLGEIKVANEQSAGLITFQTEDMMKSGFSLNDIVGIGIRLESGEYIASCWKDAYAQEIVRGEFEIQENILEQEEVAVEENPWEEPANYETQLAGAEEPQLQAPQMQELQMEASGITYEKIDLSQIRELPSPNWHLATNSFLVHGVWNYGYLVLKKEMEEDKEKLSLGVPGIFEKPEAVMAVLFGFSEFEEIPLEMVEIKINQQRDFSYKEKNQEPKTGLFGCWFVGLQN